MMPEPESVVPAKTSYVSNPFQLIRPSWEGIKLNGLTYVVLVALALGLVVVGAIMLAIFGVMVQTPTAIFILGAIVALAFMYFVIVKLSPAIYRLQLAMARQQKMSWREAMAVKPVVGWRLFWTGLLGGLAILVGLLLLIVPGIILAVWFSMMVYVVVDEGLSGTAALRRSRELVRNRFWDTAGSISLVQATGLLYVLPVIGPILIIIISLILMPVTAIRYDQLRTLKASGDGKDVATHPANYIVFALALLSIGPSYNYNKQNQAAPYQIPVEKSNEAY